MLPCLFETPSYFVAIDVGSSSVRAGLVTIDGTVVRTSIMPIKTYTLRPDYYEQSTKNIWDICTKVIQSVTEGIDQASVKGLGFDATCSLVALDEFFESVSLNIEGVPHCDVISWMDHRAIEEAKFITETGHPALRFIGGTMSPEMQPAKLLWLKNNLPEQFKKAHHFFDLPDFLTWKATGCLTRSLCSLVCKYLYNANDGAGWDATFWNEIGLPEIAEQLERIGVSTSRPGEPCGSGLSEAAARECNLLPNTPVSTSIIDCHAGAVGVLNSPASDGNFQPMSRRLAVISGTSACHVKVNKEPVATPGVWGPYFSAVFPDLHVTEGGQSAAGALLDCIIDTHPAANDFKELATDERHVTDVLNDEALLLAAKLGLPTVSHLTDKLHIYPDFHGNRSPLADANITGMISGLTLDANREDLLRKYIATLQALAYSTKHIIQTLQGAGHTIEALVFCGGFSKNKLYLQIHADVTGFPVLVPNETESILLGTAMLAATASKTYPNVVVAMASMSGPSEVVPPHAPDRSYHDKKFKAYLSLLRCQKEIREAMQ